MQELSRPITSVVDLMLFNSQQSALSAFIHTYGAVFTRASRIVIPDKRG
jgi:hypothetical protein